MDSITLSDNKIKGIKQTFSLTEKNKIRLKPGILSPTCLYFLAKINNIHSAETATFGKGTTQDESSLVSQQHRK